MNSLLALSFCVVAAIVCTLPSTEGGCFGRYRRYDYFLRRCVHRCHHLGSHCKACNARRQCLYCKPPFHRDANWKCTKGAAAAPASPASPSPPAPPAPTQGPPPQTQGPPAPTQGPNAPTEAPAITEQPETAKEPTTTGQPGFDCGILTSALTLTTDPNDCPSGGPPHYVEGQGFIQLGDNPRLYFDQCIGLNTAGIQLMIVNPATCTNVSVTAYFTGASTDDSTALANALEGAPDGTVFVAITFGDSRPRADIGPAVHALNSTCGVDVSDTTDNDNFSFVCEKGYPSKTVIDDESTSTATVTCNIQGTAGDGMILQHSD